MLTIVRGLPGSGKSTYAKSLGVFHVEADMYFLRDGVYQFDHKALSVAHAWCRMTVASALSINMDVVVSNTFTTISEMEPYLEMSDCVEVIRMSGDYGSIHGVPPATIEKMKQRFENYKGEIYG